jgi:hypothetical protein
MSNTSTRNRKAPYGPNIVRAWFDTVFQPALRGLASERAFLIRQNWTWRFTSSSLDYIGPLRARLPGRAADNLDQFLSFHRDCELFVNEHDTCVLRLQDECRAFHVALVESPRLREVFHEIAIEAPVTLGSDIRGFFGAFHTESDFIAVLAEEIVNNTETLPRHYANAPLWNKYRERIVAVLEDPALAAHKQAAMSAGADLLRGVNNLDSVLRERRSELSVEFDVPIYAETLSEH